MLDFFKLDRNTKKCSAMLSQTLLSVKQHQSVEDLGFIKVLLSERSPPTLAKLDHMREKFFFSHIFGPH